MRTKTCIWIVVIVTMMFATMICCTIWNESLHRESIETGQKFETAKDSVIKHISNEVDSMNVVLKNIETQNEEIQYSTQKYLKRDSVIWNDLKTIKEDIKRLRVGKK